ncbi:hypothetical protein PF008_g1261 [Phytophthora fragariae]|uniref:DDE Tnp4 domain-containing protein n=1 Tax=Phytophthora fragariae TaxID=53985 RepID=A0A6G0SML4_9STRA|nr:hypothetical protein PF008_g1261 [Phytophthora fragariae]
MHPSDVKKLKRGVTAAIFQLAMAQQLQEASRVGHDEGDTAEDDVLPDLVNLRHALNSVRYSVPRKNVVRSTAHQRLLYTLGDAEFRTFTRVSKNTFNVLLDLIRRRGLPAEAQQHEKTSTRRGSTTCRDAGMGIRTQINRKKDFRHVNNHILACVMLHNLGIALFDEWDDAALDDEDDDDMNSGSGGKTAKEKRERIKVVLLRM